MKDTGPDIDQTSMIVAAVQGLDEAVFIHDAESGRILWVNLRAAELYGYPEEAFPDMSVQDLSTGEPPYDMSRARELINQARNGQSSRFLWHARKSDGSNFWVENTMRPFRDNGELRVVVTVRDLSRPASADGEVRSEDSLFRLLFNEMREGVIICELVPGDPDQPGDYRILDHNRSFMELFRRPEMTAFRGQLGSEVFGDSPAPFVEIFSGVAQGGKGQYFESWMERYGKFLGISVISPRPGVFAAIISDMTGQRSLEDENTNIFRYSRNFISLLDLKGCFIKVNHSWTGLLGWLPDDLLGHPCTEFIHPEDIGQMTFLESVDDRNLPVRGMESRFRHKDGTWHWLSWDHHRSGSLRYATARDITEAKASSRAMEELLVKAHEHIRTTERLVQLGELVAGIAHEVNTPLGVATTAASFQSGNITQLRRELDQAAADPSRGFSLQRLRSSLATIDEASGMIQSNIQRASEVIASFKQVSVDQTSQQRREFHLHDVLNQTWTSLLPRFKRTPWEVTITCPETIVMDGFPGMISQIVTNLLMNALAHAFRGRLSGTIQITGERESADMVRLRFADDGNGVPPELREKIFEPFFTTNSEGGGTGLGLSIVRSLAKTKLGGTMEMESRVEGEEGGSRGTTFTFHLPVTAPGDRCIPGQG